MRVSSTGFVALFFAISIAVHVLFFSDSSSDDAFLEAEHTIQCDWDCETKSAVDRG